MIESGLAQGIVSAVRSQPHPRVARRLMEIVLIAFTLALAGCDRVSSTRPDPADQTAAAGAPTIRVLMLTATAGFRHDSIPAARQVMQGMAATSREFTLTITEDLAALTATNLAAYDVLFFALTSGELALTEEQKHAVLSFVSEGRGFLGVHSATDTLYQWADYGRLIGAYFKEHPWTQTARVVVEDSSHPATADLGAQFSIHEEFYTFQENPRPRVRVLLRLDASSVGASGDYPLAWAHAFGNGRVYYNALGHFSETWQNPSFQRQVLGAIRWAAPAASRGIDRTRQPSN